MVKQQAKARCHALPTPGIARIRIILSRHYTSDHPTAKNASSWIWSFSKCETDGEADGSVAFTPSESAPPWVTSIHHRKNKTVVRSLRHQAERNAGIDNGTNNSNNDANDNVSNGSRCDDDHAGIATALASSRRQPVCRSRTRPSSVQPPAARPRCSEPPRFRSGANRRLAYRWVH